MGWGNESQYNWFMNVNTIRLCHMTIIIWLPCPYMIKTFKNLLFWNRKADDLETWYAALVTQVLPRIKTLGMTLTYFTARSNLVPFVFKWEMLKLHICKKLLKPLRYILSNE